MDPAPGAVMWEGTARARWGFWAMLAMVLTVGITVVLVSGDGGWPPGLLLLGVCVAVGAWFVEVRVTVDEQAVRVRSGVVAWPGVRIPLVRIASVRAIDLHPMRWGGWGYRGSVRLFGRAAWVLRAGPGLEVTDVRGGRFAVSVDGADDAAAVINDLLARTRSD